MYVERFAEFKNGSGFRIPYLAVSIIILYHIHLFASDILVVGNKGRESTEPQG